MYARNPVLHNTTDLLKRREGPRGAVDALNWFRRQIVESFSSFKLSTTAVHMTCNVIIMLTHLMLY